MAGSKHKSKIGGQALIEGIMMRGVYKSAMAVRLPDKTIDVEEWDTQSGKKRLKVLRLPFIRGIFNFIDSLVSGYRCLMKSAEKSGMDLEMDEEPTKFEKWLDDKFGDNIVKIVTYIGAALGVILALVLFMYLPALIVKGINSVADVGIFRSLIEGIIKIIVFIIYLWLTSKLSDIARVYKYHGAEHKTIACFEAGEELTVENIKKQSRFHPRCGTSFIIIVLIISILVFSVVTWSSLLIRVLLKLLLLPVVVGISYEIIMLAGRYDNIVTRIISFPGLMLQRLTTNEPDDDQIEVAIEAIKPCIPQNLEDDRW